MPASHRPEAFTLSSPSSRSASNSPPHTSAYLDPADVSDGEDEDHDGLMLNTGDGTDKAKGKLPMTSEVANDGAQQGEEDDEDGDERYDSADGMLLRDLPKRSVFYDPVAERQMSQSDAKLIYQQSQLDLQKAAQEHMSQQTPTGSPVMLAHGDATHSMSRSPHGSKFSDHFSRHSTFARGPGPGVGEDVAAASLRATEGASVFEGSVAQSHDLYGASSTRVATPSAAMPEANDTGISIGEPAGIGSSTYADADPQITSELAAIFKSVQKVIDLRHKYLRLSLQGSTDNPKDEPGWLIYPPPPEPAWAAEHEAASTGTRPTSSLANSLVLQQQQQAQSPLPNAPDTPKRQSFKKRKPGQDIGEDFDMRDLMPLPGESEMVYHLDENGVYQVYENEKAADADTPIVSVPTLREFYMDLEPVLSVSADGPSKSFAYRRLQYLEGKFSLYALLNEYQETADTKRVPHRDFYNVRKVDTHVHHSACMNQKHLLRFIKSKMKKCPDEVVIYRDGRHLTLAEVFESINLTAYDLSIDTLDMHAHTDSFHRFDKFNLKYNPIGESRLRTIFLKTDNDIQGRYLAEISKEVMEDLESSKYQMVEWRISIYGKSLDEWEKLAAWVVDNKLFSHNVRWLIQIPRLFDVYKASGLMESFEQVIKNVFEPLFEATRNPQAHPKLHIFLQRVIGFDSVDDESKVERRLYKKFPVPKVWDSKQNPPYSYWIYYLFSNMATLNTWRKQRGFNTFVLRPHCGEAGDYEHLAVAALCSHSISHGLLLRKVPLLQYIFYLEQIGIAMSPLSNNALFLAYERNPFHQYFKRGLNVSLSTDDPLQFAFTKEPLIEEYAVAAQIYKLSPVDMCELAKNSVMQSGYEASVKAQWLGSDFNKPGMAGNTMVKTNIPDRRSHFRYSTLLEERQMIEKYTQLIPTKEGDAGLRPETVAPAPKSPVVSHKLPAAAAAAPAGTPVSGPTGGLGQAHTGSFVSLPAAARPENPTSQINTTATSPYMGATPSHITPGSLMSSPMVMSKEAVWPADGGLAGDAHLVGSETRYFPGVATRRQRKNSMRQGSWHEADEPSGGRLRKASTRDSDIPDEEEEQEEE